MRVDEKVKAFGNWRKSATGFAIVSDSSDDTHHLDLDSIEGYGGYLVCESVSPKAMPLLLAAPDLLAACERALCISDHADGCRALVANISELRTMEQIEANSKKCDCHLRDAAAAVAKAKAGAS